MSNRTAIVLAAGKGTRMKSRLPKVLHPVAGSPLIDHVMTAVSACGIARPVVIVGHGGEQVTAHLGERARSAWQHEQLGTGHAVMMARDLVEDHTDTVLVVCGDTPLVTAGTLRKLIDNHERNGCQATVLTALLDDPTGYGRIIRAPNHQVAAIVEHKDATEEQRLVKEINSGTYCFDRKQLFDALTVIRPANAQREYYLTDVLQVIAGRGGRVGAVVAEDAAEILGINSRQQLAEAEHVFQQRLRAHWMAEGVTMIDPQSVFLSTHTVIGQDTVLYPHVLLEGKTVIGEGCAVGPGCRIRNSKIGDHVSIQNSIILDSEIGHHCSIGPFAYIRPGTELGEEVKVGDFVEIKKSVLGARTKVPHLSYVGDALIGNNVNIGAGTITCNYDGLHKSTTTIQDGAFIGSNTNLVAPVTVEANAIIGAGSTITKDVPANSLAVERSRQIVKEKYGRRREEKR